MARPRVPSLYAFIQLVARSLDLLASLAELGILIYLTTHFAKNGQTHVPAIITTIVASLTDAAEIAGLLDPSRTVKRFHTGFLICFDIVVIILAIVSLVLILMSDYHYGNAPSNFPRPWRPMKELAAWLLCAILAWRFVLAVWGCTDCGCRRRARKKAAAQEASRDPAGEEKEDTPEK